jgi:hypothetical protein
MVEVASAAFGPPFYGLVPPGGTCHADHEVSSVVLARPFPLSDTWAWEDEMDESDQALLDRIEQVHSSGILLLGTDGCGMDYVLVVTGAARGQVWQVTGEFAWPVASDFGTWVVGELYDDAVSLMDSRPGDAECP